MKNNIKPIGIPPFLETNFIFSHFKIVSVDKVYVGLINSNLEKIKYVNVKKSPHYYFVCEYLGIKSSYKQSTINYFDYIKSNTRDLKSEIKFIQLIESIKKNGYNYKENPILVYRTIKKPFPLGRFFTADGFHRLSILAALGHKNINVGVLKRKQSFISRLKKRFNEI